MSGLFLKVLIRLRPLTSPYDAADHDKATGAYKKTFVPETTL
jgi:hypothetical protein